MREKPHRLPDAAYYGKVAVAFTACVEMRKPLFLRPDVVELFAETLRHESSTHKSEISIYCFMPDHLHVIIRGTEWASRPKTTMDSFKYVTGCWLAANLPEYEWQEDYYDHIIRNGEDADGQTIYIACNPVRAGIATSPLDYPFTGSFATDWKELLASSMP
ncbi:MAG: REP-associated tyrosine transposase [Fimbriimonadales bacterium]